MIRNYCVCVVLLLVYLIAEPIHTQIARLKAGTICSQPSEGKTTVKWGFCSNPFKGQSIRLHCFIFDVRTYTCVSRIGHLDHIIENK